MNHIKIHFSTTINAPKEKVWKILLDDSTYRQWVAAFMEGSYAETTWEEGSKALFLNEERSGMTSRITEHIPNRIIVIEHRGVVNEGIENFENEAALQWRGTREIYRVEETGERTHLVIDQDVTSEYKDYFEEAWPKALQKVKVLSEAL